MRTFAESINGIRVTQSFCKGKMKNTGIFNNLSKKLPEILDACGNV